MFVEFDEAGGIGCLGEILEVERPARAAGVVVGFGELLRLPEAPVVGFQLQCCAIFFFKNSTLRASCSMPSTPSSMLIQPLKPLLFSSVKMAS
jgi:hypothetical protein